MALVNCIECANEVSDSALNCPQCGVQLNKLQRSFLGKFIKFLFITFNIVVILIMLIGVLAGFFFTLLPFWLGGNFVLGFFLLLTRPRR